MCFISFRGEVPGEPKNEMNALKSCKCGHGELELFWSLLCLSLRYSLTRREQHCQEVLPSFHGISITLRC